MKKILTLTLSIILSQSVFAVSYKYDCGKTFNIPRSAVIKSKAPGQDGYTLAASYTTSGNDETTGTIVMKTYNMVGQTDLSSELTGNEIPVIALSKVGDPNFQVVIAKTEKIGSVVPAAEINLTENEMTRIKCTLKSFNK